VQTGAQNVIVSGGDVWHTSDVRHEIEFALPLTSAAQSCLTAFRVTNRRRGIPSL